MESWKEKAAAYWNDGLRVEDISVLLEVSRQSISAYLKTLPGYAEEKARRKRESAARRREYKTEKQRQYRAVSGIMAVTAETMRREHDLAALELSREIYPYWGLKLLFKLLKKRFKHDEWQSGGAV